MYALPPAVINVESVTPNRACNPDNAATCTLAPPPLTLLHGGGGGGATAATGGSSAGVVGEEEDDDEEQLNKYKKAMMNR